MLEFTELVAIANMRGSKRSALEQADEVLTRLRLLFRISFEMKFINLNSYEFGSCQIAELGKMLGGWMKKLESLLAGWVMPGRPIPAIFCFRWGWQGSPN